jgi:hypothetical protein
MLLAYAVLDELIGLAISLPASALVVREREARTWSLLRVTPFSSAQIAAGKLSGLLYQVWEGVGYLVSARWIGTLLVLPLLALMLTLPRAFPLASGPGAGLAAAGLLAAYLCFVHRPLFNLVLGGAIGLAASTLARSSGGAVLLAVLIGGAMTITSGAAIWSFAASFEPAALFSESVLAGRLAQVFVWLIPMAGVTLARLVLTGVLLAVAGRRIADMPE